MQNILTKSEIQAYHAKGIQAIPVKELPLLTDLAREELERLGMELVLESPAPQAVQQAAQTAAPPSSGGGYGGGLCIPAAGESLCSGSGSVPPRS